MLVPVTEASKRAFFQKYLVDAPHKCWPWKGAFQGGFGAFQFQGNRIAAHRFSYQVYSSLKLSRSQKIEQTCGNKKCVNPSHLKLGGLKRLPVISVSPITYRNLELLANSSKKSLKEYIKFLVEKAV